MGRIVLHLTQMAKASPIKFIKWKPFNLRFRSTNQVVYPILERQHQILKAQAMT